MKRPAHMFAVLVLAATATASRATDRNWTGMLALLREAREINVAVQKASGEQRKALQEKQSKLQARVAELKKSLPGDGWTKHTFRSAAHRKDRSGNDLEMTVRVWMPPGAAGIRGVFICMWGALVHDPFMRAACRDGRLAIFHFEGLDGLFNYTKGAGEALEGALTKATEITGHPELRNAPFLTLGMSTSVIGARNIAYWRPDRTLGVIHTSGGNMHHCLYDPTRTLAGVPFLAVNGEMEKCGPEGGGHKSGAAGIRPEYGFQTQWVMMRDSMIERQIKDPSHLMNILVMPNAGHGGWSDETACVCGLFMVKAARYRLPGGYPDGKATADGCVRIDPKAGWLTDANLKAPQFKPAPYDKYKGDQARAFWHFDEEMARATVAYHTRVFDRPDPAWGPLDMKAVRAFNLLRTEGPEPALKALLALCDAAENAGRAEAVGYLGRLQPAGAKAIPKLIAMFGERPIPSLNEALVAALARHAPSSVQPLLDAAKHDDGNVRAGVVRTLTRIKEPSEKILAVAKAAAEDRHPRVRHAAFDALVSMKADPASIGAAGAAVLDDLAKAGESVAFSNTCNVVVRLGPDVLGAAVPALIRAVANPDYAIFAPATAGILAVKPKPPAETVSALSASLLTSDTNRWMTAVNAIHRIDTAAGNTKIVTVCITQLRNKDNDVADLAADLICRLGSKTGTPAFRKQAAKTILEVLDSDAAIEQRRRAVRSLGAFGTDAKDAVPELNMALEEPGLREAAQKALAEIDAGDGPDLYLDI